jgi:hypothetical protein
MNRKSKIARLPSQIRDQLNRALDDNKEGKELVAWLNALPETRALLAAEFEGRPITEQNLSDWRKTGFPDWQRQQEKRALVRELAEEAQELVADAGGVDLSRGLAVVLGAELVVAIRDGLRDTTDRQQRWKLLLEAMAQVTRLRREDHKAGKLAIEQERWQQEKQKTKREEAAWEGVAEDMKPFAALAQREMATTMFGQPDICSQAAGIAMTERLLAKQERVNGKPKGESSQIQGNPG